MESDDTIRALLAALAEKAYAEWREALLRREGQRLDALLAGRLYTKGMEA